jgi:hypothetical protein
MDPVNKKNAKNELRLRIGRSFYGCLLVTQGEVKNNRGGETIHLRFSSFGEYKKTASLKDKRLKTKDKRQKTCSYFGGVRQLLITNYEPRIAYGIKFPKGSNPQFPKGSNSKLPLASNSRRDQILNSRRDQIPNCLRHQIAQHQIPEGIKF